MPAEVSAPGPFPPGSAEWRALLCRCLDRAEQAVAAYYAIRPREWSIRFRYDLAPATEHPELPFHDGALAQIVRLSGEGLGRPDRFRIVLREEELLRQARPAEVEGLVTATLAHELVHLVRFGQGLACFDLEGELQREEEQRVERITCEALAGAAAHPSGRDEPPEDGALL